MTAQLRELITAWRRDFRFTACGIGFGGPVNFEAQRVVLSTHVGGWTDFDLCGFVGGLIDAPVVMDNDANVGALGEAEYGAGIGCSPLFYMTLSTGIGGGIYDRGQIWRGADSYGGEIGHLTIRPDGPECLCGARGCFERMCCGLWLERDHGRTARELLRGRCLCRTLCGRPGARPQGGHHAAEPGADRDRRRYQQGGRPPVRSASRRAPAADNRVVRGTSRYSTSVPCGRQRTTRMPIIVPSQTLSRTSWLSILKCTCMLCVWGQSKSQAAVCTGRHNRACSGSAASASKGV